FLQQMAEGSLRPEDPEQYQQKALSQWLPVALKGKGSAEYRALRGLAEVFAEHQDSWWRDFLDAAQVGEGHAAAELSEAILNNEKGRHDEALAHANRAELEFHQRRNIPGELLAGFAKVYALRSKLQGTSCLARASPIWDKLSKTSYRWLQAQLLLEEAQC